MIIATDLSLDRGAKNLIKSSNLPITLNYEELDSDYVGFEERLSKLIMTYEIDNQKTIIGNNVHIGDNCYFNTRGKLYIGDNSHISRNVTIYTVNHVYDSGTVPYNNEEIYKSVIIEENVWIGMNVSIIPGVTIGEGAIVGLGCVVNSDVEKFSIIGQPCYRVLKKRDETLYNSAIINDSIGGVGGRFISSDILNRYPVTPKFKNLNISLSDFSGN